MTTTASFTALHAPVAEDSMEMSSPANPTYDDDIDIDFDENVGGGVELTDDERMLEDNEQPRPATATDDMMEDDDPQQEPHVPEQEMQDDFDAAAYEQADPDDELIDYGEDDYEDMAHTLDETAYQPPAPEINIEDRELDDPVDEQVDGEVVREHEAFAPEPQPVPEPEPAVVEEVISEQVPNVQDISATESTAPVEADVATTEAAIDASDIQADGQAGENATADDVEDVGTTGEDEEHTHPDQSEQHEIHHVAVTSADEPFPELPAESPEEQITAPIPAPLDTSLTAGDDAPGTPTDTGLHPMVVQYGDWEWPLFKSRRQPEGLLKDDNLASVALADLLNNCRYRLALKVGEDISNDQEFVLRFDSMGLAIVENSPSAFNTSLDEVLEVYKQLHVNDGAQTVPPFWLHLSLQPKFTSYLTMLKQAAAGGQGISSFVDVPADEVPEGFGEYYPDGDDDPTLYGDASAAEFHDPEAHDDQDAVAEPALAEGDYHEYDTSYENTEGGQEAQEGYEQYDETEQAEYDDYGEGDDANGPADAENSQNEENNDTANVDVEDPENSYVIDEASHHEGDAESSDAEAQEVSVDLGNETEHKTAASEPDAADEATREDEGEGSNVESAASSTTLRADQASEPVGEYKDEDLIEWDDSTLTNYLSEHGTDDNDEFSTFLTEVDLQAADGSGVGDNTTANDTAGAAVQNGVAIDDTAQASQKDTHDSLSEVAKPNNEGDDGDHQYEEIEDTQASSYGAAGDKEHGDGNSQADASSQKPQPQTAASDEDHTHESDSLAKTNLTEKHAGDDEDYIDFGDDIDFDDDTYEQHEARKASEANNSGSKSPLGKRPLDQTGGVDLEEQPELKKVRSS